MRVKIKDVWFEVKLGQPIMVELSDDDKKNLASLVTSGDGNKYAAFDENEKLTREEMLAWMDE